jgi:RNA 3'-terminal phosphate cyclase (ATP)
MLVLDGSRGEGGGQVLRTSLALSLATGTPFRMERIRAKRRKPGLKPQHLASVRAAAAVGDAEFEGAEKGSRRLVFVPRKIVPGEIHVDVGTAGSAVLVLQTVLPPLLTAARPSTLVVDGGTHNPFAPPYEFLANSYLPVVERLGPRLGARLVRPGFMPAGGGRIELSVEPAPALDHLELLEHGEILARRATSIVAHLPASIAERELRIVERRLGWPSRERFVREVTDAAGPGNALVLEIACEHVTAVFFAPGKQGLPAETVAARAVTEALAWLDADVPVCEHLADQLLLPLALGAGGAFRTTPLSSHAKTQVELIGTFLDAEVDVERDRPGSVRVNVKPR